MVAKKRKSFGESQTCSAGDANTQFAGALASSSRSEKRERVAWRPPSRIKSPWSSRDHTVAVSKG